MATIVITNEDTGSSTGADPSTSNSSTWSATPGSTDHVFLWIGASNSSAPAPVESTLSIAGGGITWTLLTFRNWKSRRSSWLWVGTGWTGGDSTIDMTFAADPQEVVWIVDVVTNLDSTVPYRAIHAKAAPNVNLTTWSIPTGGAMQTGDVTYACVHLENNETALAAAGFVESGTEAGGTLGVRLAKTAYDTDQLTDAAWTWGGANKGVGGVTLILSGDTYTAPGPQLVQWKRNNNNGSGGDITVVFDSTPTVGNMLVAVHSERNVAFTSQSISSPSGYTDRGYVRVTEDSTTRRGMVVYTKVAGSSEATSVVATASPGSGLEQMTIMEFSGVEAFDQISYIDNGTTTSATTLTSGSITTTEGSALVAIWVVKNSTASPEDFDNIITKFSNDFITTVISDDETIHSMIHIVGLAEKASSGTYDTATTLDARLTINTGLQIALLSFDLPSVGGPAAATDNPALIGASI